MNTKKINTFFLLIINTLFLASCLRAGEKIVLNNHNIDIKFSLTSKTNKVNLGNHSFHNVNTTVTKPFLKNSSYRETTTNKTSIKHTPSIYVTKETPLAAKMQMKLLKPSEHSKKQMLNHTNSVNTSKKAQKKKLNLDLKKSYNFSKLSNNSYNLTILKNSSLSCETIKAIDKKSFQIRQLLEKTLYDYKTFINQTVKTRKTEKEIEAILKSFHSLDGTVEELHDMNMKSLALNKYYKCGIYYFMDNYNLSKILYKELFDTINSHLKKIKIKYLLSANPNKQLVFAEIKEKTTLNYKTNLADKRLLNVIVNKKLDAL